jgi:hypothetical protein
MIKIRDGDEMFNEFEVVGMSVMDCGVNIQILVKL